MRIKVTAEHIDKGRAVDCNLCPVALAINAVLKPPYRAETRYGRTDFYNNDEVPMNTPPYWGPLLDAPHDLNAINSMNHPQEVYDFIHNFDRLQPVVPSEFELAIPAEYLKEVT